MKKAFTMAEVLITIAILGVIIAVTLPSLIGGYRAKILDTSFKKAYTNAAHALMLTKAELGVDNIHESFTHYDPDADEYTNSQMFIDSYYKKMMVTGEVNYNKPVRNYTLDRNFQADSITCLPTKILADGTSMCVHIWSGTISVTVDINGPQKMPNAFGHDIFMFRVDYKKDMLVGQKPANRAPNPDSAYPETDARPCSTKYSTAGNGLGCSFFALVDSHPDVPGARYFENLPR